MLSQKGKSGFVMIGGGIAEENPFYCELTAQYWGWKNLGAEIKNIGIVHYRRYFMDYRISSQNFWEDVVSVERIDSILENYDIIIPFLTSKAAKKSILYKNVLESEQDQNWCIIYKIMRKNHPREFEAFKNVIYGKKQVWCNMFISSKRIYDRYCEWLFGVLKEYDEFIRTVKKEERTPRVDGFLAELLLLVWVEAHISRDKVYHLGIKNSEEASSDVYGSGVKNRLMRMIYCNHKLFSFCVSLKTSLVVCKRHYFKG